MRSPRLPAWARCVLSAGALLLAAVGLAPGAAAEEKFAKLYVFGDSYADLTLSDKAPLNPEGPAGVKLSFWRVYPVALAANLKINDAQIFDFAVGGATASPFGKPALPPGWNLPQQVEAFNLTGRMFGERDLVTINIGGNDIRNILTNSAAQNKAFGYLEDVLTPLTAKAFADQTTAYTTAQIDRLVTAGARNFVLGAFSSISGLPEVQDNLAKLPPNVTQVVAASADAYAKSYFDGLQTSLGPSAQSGVRYFVFDLARLGQAVNDNPARYGFTLPDFFRCPANGLAAPFGAVCGATPTNPTNNNPLQSQYYFGPDGLHLTNAGFELVARYMTNIVLAPDTIAVQPDIVKATASGFTSSLLDRLGGTRQLVSVAGSTASTDDDGAMGLGRRDKSRTGPPSRFTTFALGSLFGGSRGETPDLVGYEYDATAGTAGIEYSVNRNVIVGLAGNYTTTNADLTSGAHVNLDAVQVAAYWSYATRNIFADVLMGAGWHDIGLVRPGVIDPVRSETDALTFAIAGRTGYLFDLGKVRAGPIAGLTYIHARVDGYTEKGDPLLTFDVASQTLDSLTGHIGVRLLAPFKAGDGLVIPYLNVTLEHQFGDDTRLLTASLTQAPLLPILSSISTFDARTYGKVEGGLTLQLNPGLGATISGSSTFARDEARDFSINAGLNFKF